MLHCIPADILEHTILILLQLRSGVVSSVPLLRIRGQLIQYTYAVLYKKRYVKKLPYHNTWWYEDNTKKKDISKIPRKNTLKDFL